MVKREDVDPAMRVLAGLFIVGMFLYQCDSAPSSDGPVEHSCWTETGEVSC